MKYSNYESPRKSVEIRHKQVGIQEKQIAREEMEKFGKELRGSINREDVEKFVGRAVTDDEMEEVRKVVFVFTEGTLCAGQEFGLTPLETVLLTEKWKKVTDALKVIRDGEIGNKVAFMVLSILESLKTHKWKKEQASVRVHSVAKLNDCITSLNLDQKIVNLNFFDGNLSVLEKKQMILENLQLLMTKSNDGINKLIPAGEIIDGNGG